MIETVALWIGLIFMFFSILSLLSILIGFTFYMYDCWLEKILGWKNVQDIFNTVRRTDY